MVVYGFTDFGVAQGEIIGAEIQSGEAKSWPLETFRQNMGWEYIDTTFALVKHELIRRMETDGVSEELIENVRSMKARDIPVLTSIS